MTKSIRRDEFLEVLSTPSDEHRSNFVFVWNGESYTPPKKDIDYASFFFQCPSYDEADDVEDFFEIDWNSSNPSTVNSSILTVFLVSRFIYYIKDIVRSGLKKGYVLREENLKSKVKGRILHGPNIRMNVIPGHQERLFCSFQEYTVDIPINRILKATLFLCRDIIANQSNDVITRNVETSELLLASITNSLSYMHNVGQESQPARVCGKVEVPHGKLFRNYEEAMKLAKIILRLEDSYFISKQKAEYASLPSFWIYLPTMFEHYVFGKIKKQLSGTTELLIQPRGSYNQRADFIIRNPMMVVDAKYKWWYKYNSIPEKKRKDFIADLRELSGYARDHNYFDTLTDIIPCFIVYPVEELNDKQKDVPVPAKISMLFSDDSFGSIEPIPGIRSFYKIGLKLPTHQVLCSIQEVDDVL